jgi:hypothetical protein
MDQYEVLIGVVKLTVSLFSDSPGLGVIALYPRWRTLSLSECGGLQGAPFGGMLEVYSNQYSSHQEPLYGSYYADEGPVDNHLAAVGGATLRLTRPGCAPA